MHSPGEAVPGSQDPEWRAAQAPGRGGVDSDLCLHTGFLVAAVAALASHTRLCTPVAVLSSVAPKLPPSATRSLRPRRAFLVCGNISSFTAPSQWCRSRPYSNLCFFFFLLPYPGTWAVSCLLGGLRCSASFQ